MTQFRALPVSRGDACLLKSSRGSYLVDGGNPSGNLPSMLRERQVGKLRAVVCTFPSPERLGGILDLLENGYPITECWLPVRLGTLPRLASQFNGDWSGWLEMFGRKKEAPPFPVQLHFPKDNPEIAGATILLALAVTALTGTCPTANRSTPSNIIVMVHEILTNRMASRWMEGGATVAEAMRVLGVGLLKGGGRHELGVLCCRLLLTELDGMPVNNKQSSIIRGLVLAALASLLVGARNIRVRYFKRVDHLVTKIIPRHPFVCLNGKEVTSENDSPNTTPPERIYREAACMSSKGRGLVYQFGSGECSALFCGDSKFAFLGRSDTVSLNIPTVITAPNQGGPYSDDAYSRIKSEHPERDIWVRTHYSYKRQISDRFKGQQNCYCLNNCALRTAQEILLEFRQGYWCLLAGGECARQGHRPCLSTPMPDMK